MAFMKKQGYQVNKKLGEGAFGAVYVAKNIETNEKVAIKLLHIASKEEMKKCINEASQMAEINSPHVVKFIKQFFDPIISIFYIVSQFCSNGDLEHYMEKNVLSQSQIIKLFKGVLLGIIDLQKKKIIHGDLKLQNIVISAEGNSLLTDFGFSKSILPAYSSISMAGKTIAYCPEEQEYGKLTLQTDYYSAGMILLMMCRPSTNPIEMIMMKTGKFPEDVKSSCNYELIQIAFKMMNKVPKDRMHPKDALTLLESFEKSPKKLTELQPQKNQSSITFKLQIKKISFPNGDKYEGEWKENQRNGFGKLFYYNGNTYEGEWKNDKRHGNGKQFSTSGHSYIGQWKEDKRNGKGNLWFANGDIYEGEFQDNKFNGFGKVLWPNGSRYEGQWKNDKRSGQGMLFLENGDQYEGQFQDGLFNGFGKVSWATGISYEGEWKNDKMNGQGTKFNKLGEIIQKGEWYQGNFKG